MKTRRVISLTMFISFFMMSYTGVMLFFCPQGRVAYWTGWHLLGLNKEQYGELHTTFMLVFLVAGVWHIVLNWKLIKKYLRNKARKITVFRPELNVALALNVIFLVGTLAGLPPWSSFIDVGEAIKDYWERHDGSPPWGHAEENTIDRFARGLVNWERIEHNRQVTLSAEDAITTLRQAGVEVENEREKLIDIATANNTTPQALMEIIRQAERPATGDERSSAPPSASDSPFPSPMSGLGRMTLRTYCERYDVDLERATALLAEDGPVDVDRRLREVASDRGTDPEGLLDLLNERASGAL